MSGELKAMLTDAIEALGARQVKILEQAEEEGWGEPAISLVIRLNQPPTAKPGHAPAIPFYLGWQFVTVDAESGKRAWRFQGARAKNTQPLSYSDVAVYLASPEVIYPEPPKEVLDRAAPGQPCFCPAYSFTPHTHAAKDYQE